MKKFFAYLLITASLLTVRAQLYTENRFQQSEDETIGTTRSNDMIGGEQVEKGPGHPPGDDDVPIDDYIPVLAVLGVGIIIYKYHYKIIKS